MLTTIIKTYRFFCEEIEFASKFLPTLLLLKCNYVNMYGLAFFIKGPGCETYFGAPNYFSTVKKPSR